MIEAIIFDMDGLMFDTESLNMRGWIYAGTLHGHAITEEQIRKHIGSNLAATKKMMTEQMGPGFDFDAVRQDRIDYAFRHIEEHGTPLKKGLRELLRYLKEKGFKTAIASSSEERFVQYYLRHAKLDHEFDAVVCGNKVERSKPHPDIFLKAASDLGCSPDECLVLEDSLHGVTAASRAGMRVVMIPDLVQPTPDVEALLCSKLDNLEEVIPLLDSMGGKTAGTADPGV